MSFDLSGILLPCVIVAAVIVVLFCELIKKADKKNKLKGLLVYIPIGLSMIMALLLAVGDFFTFRQVPFYGAVIFALSVFEYEGILRKFKTPKSLEIVSDAESSGDVKNEKPT